MRYSISNAIPHNPKSKKHPYENLVKSRLETIWEDIRDYDKSTFYLPQQYLNNTRIERMCLLLDKTDYQIPGTLEFGNLFWVFATFKNTAGRSEVLPGAT